jgi:hypothetical protein
MASRVVVLSAWVLAAPALAEEPYEQARIWYVEPGVALQRLSESGAEEALVNAPFLPGDRVFTDRTGRVEFQFGDGTVARLDSRSKLDYAGAGGRGGDRIVLRLWSGGLYVRTRTGSLEFEVETPGGLVAARRRGLYRIDVESGETLLSVYEGEATLESDGRRQRLEEGERATAFRGEPPEGPRAFDRLAADDFARWNDEREERADWASGSERYLPEEVVPYASELEDNGSWYYESEVGYVWRPHVAVGWRPYRDGRWCWTSYGWTWIPYEPWGWATAHYGRWGYSPVIGWYWIPGRTWGPAWVAWAVGHDRVGWCPLGHRDRPVVVHDRSRGRAVPRGSGTRSDTSPWTYVRHGDLSARDLAHRRMEGGEPETAGLRIVDAARAHLDRELRIAEGQAAVPRNIKTRPTPGDTVPELRADPLTTIPFPTPKRRRPREDEPVKSEPREYRPPLRNVGSSPNREARPDEARPGRERPARDETPNRPVARPADPVRDTLKPFLDSIRERPRREDAPPSGGRDAARPMRPPDPPRAEPRRAEPPPRAEPPRPIRQPDPPRAQPSDRNSTQSPSEGRKEGARPRKQRGES